MTDEPDYVPIGSAGVGEQQQYQADFGDGKNGFTAEFPLAHLRNRKPCYHAGQHEYDGGGNHSSLQPLRNQDIEKQHCQKDCDQSHDLSIHLDYFWLFIIFNPDAVFMK